MLAELLGQPVWYLRQTMPQDEFIKWIAYLNHKRPDTQEQQLAVLTTVAANAMGGKHKVMDFIINKSHNTTSSKPVPMPMEAVRSVFSGIAKKA